MEKIIQMLQACADPTRLRILSLLRDGPLCVCDLVAVLGLSQPLISRHCAVLRHSELVLAKRVEKWVLYSIDRSNTKFMNTISAILAQIAEDTLILEDRMRLNRRVSNGLCSARSK
jgi:ArsR family transcriptional regulator